MISLTATDFRNTGLAETKYLVEGELEYRREVARCIRIEAWYNYSDWILPGNEKTLIRHGRLLRQADRFELCRLQYSRIGCGSCGGIFIGPRRCEVRVCEPCAKKYAFKLIQRQVALAKVLEPSADGRRLMMFTGTLVRHRLYGPTHKDVDRLFRAFKKMMHTLWPTKNGCGALAVMEIGGNFNLHIHAIIYGHFVDKFKLSALWHKFTGDSEIILIRQIKKPEGAIGYLVKYITKPDPMKNPERTAQWLSLMIGQRRVRTYGIFYRTVRLFMPPTGCPCPFCKGKLGLIGFDSGTCVPAKALFWDEAFELANTKEN